MKNYTMLKILRNEQRGSSKLARFLQYKSCANDCSVQCDSSVAVSMTLGESPSNHPEITQKSPSNHPVLSRKWLGNCSWMNRVWKYTAMLLMVLTLGVGEMWGAWYVSGDLNSWSTTAMTQSSANTNIYYLKVSGSQNFKIRPNTDNWTGEKNNSNIDNTAGYIISLEGSGNITGGSSGETWYICYNTSTQKVFGVFAMNIAGNNWGSPAIGNWSTSGAEMTYDGASTFSKTVSSVTAAAHEFKVTRCNTNSNWNNAVGYSSVNVSCVNGTVADASGNIKFTPSHAGSVIITYNWSTGKVAVQCPYQVSYAAGTGATGTVSASSITTYGSTCTLSSSTFSKTGYTQDGWATSDGGDKVYNLGGTYTGGYTDVTLYPHWKANTTTVTLNLNGGTAGSTSVTATYGAALPSFTLATRTGSYNLTGYWTESSGGTKVINADGTFAANSGIWNRTDGSTLTLYAQWSSFLTVTYDGNGNTGGTAPTDATEYSSGATVTVKAKPDGLVKTGYSFTGWKSGGVTYTAGQTFTITANTTLVAQWSENTYTVTISGGTASTTTAGISTTGTATVSLPAGKKFTGWALGSGVTLVTGTTSSATITFHASQASSVTAGFADRAGVKVYFAKPSSGWTNVYAYAWKDGGTNNSWPGTDITSTTETVNYVTYNVFQYYTEADGIGGDATGSSTWDEVIFNNDSGTQTADLSLVNGHYYFKSTAEGTSGKTAALTSAWCIKGDWNSWNEDADQITHSTAAAGSKAITLTTGAKEFKIYNIVNETWWRFPGNVTATKSATAMDNSDGNMTITPSVANSYTFALGSLTGTPTLAITYPTTYTLSYSVGTEAGNDGSISTSPSTTSGSKVLSGTTITLTAPAPKTGYTWNGWYTDDAGTTGKINDTDRAISVTMNADKTLYACYNENTYNATVSAGTGGSVSPNGTVAIKQATGTSLTATALAGYKFSDWTISGGGITPSTSSTSPQTFKATTTGGTIQANFARTYAFIEGRFHITNADRDGTWTNTFEDGDADAWDIESTRIPFEYDNTNHLFYLRTYATPKELTTNISDIAPYFFIKVSSSSSSLTGVTTYRPYSGADSNRKLTTAGDSYKKATVTSSNDHSYQFSSEDESGYVKLYFNQSHIWYWLEQTLEYDANGGTGDAPAKTYHDKGTNATAASNTFTRDGYTFSGWKTAPSSGTSYSAGASVTMNSNITLYAQWAANDYTITLDQQTSATGYSASGTASVPTVTYNAVLPAISGTMPTTTGYYGFMGFYTEENGEGERLTDGTGAWIASVDGYTDADKKWIYPGDVTLYAYYRTATIGSISLGGETAFAQNTSVTATATIEPTPVSTTIICWRLLHYTDNPVDPQPTFTPASGTSVTFTTPEASGMYKIEATLRTGSSCGAGDELGSNTQSFQVAGEHTVTILYKCGDVTLREATSMTGRPLSWSDEISAPEIFGYTFTRWDTDDGVTITDDDGETTKNTSTAEDIKVKATYDGRLTAVYTQKSMIFFKNTLEWEQVYVNFLGEWGYWNDPKGSGNQGVTHRNKAMTQIDETDVWYYDYGADDIEPSMYVSFTEDQQGDEENGYQYFWKASPGENVVYPANYADDINTDKSSETGFKATTPMFVPLADQTPVPLNEDGGGWANYYNSGYWTQYTAGTGYTLEVYNSDGTVLEKSIAFTSSDDLMPMSATVDLEGGIPYKFQIRRGGTGDNGVYYGNDGTMTYTNHGQDVAWDLGNSSFSMCGITTNASGDYTFNLSYSPYNESYYRIRIAVDYPVATGDYRLIYTDTKPTCKPSAIVPLVNNGKDTVSFFVRKDSSPSLRIQKATVANNGTVTWAEYPTAGTPTNQITSSIASAITQDSVYNFCLEMNESGVLSVTKAEPYTGSYYIRVDCANSKWDNYRTDRDHLMTYSDYSENHAGYSHYYTHWVDCSTTGRKNVKFCIANDYSPSISDTLARETASGIWENIENYIEEGGDLKRNANVRFMWNRHDNTISRAYVDGAQEDDSHFLQILSDDSKIKNAAGDAVLNEVTFTDKGNWLYEAKVKTQPNAKIKLKSTWGEENTIEQYFKGSSSTTATLIGGSGDNWYDIRLIYDFKTNRLVTAYLPSGTLEDILEIHADIMFLREHQNDVTQIDFTGDGKIKEIETVYSVLQFNMWTLNNRSKNSGHALLNPLLSRYERDLFYVSFPYDVKLSDVIGFGTYGKHWIIEYYDGEERAQKGCWADSPPFWKFVTPAMKNSFTLKAGTGYIVALDLDELWWKANNDKADVWKNTDVVELLFPGKVDSISSASVTYNLPAHKCSIGPRFENGDDRTIKDSHWNVLGVPTYHNLSSDDVSAPNTTWTAKCPNYIYTWNAQDNTLTARAAADFEYHAMHAYMVQYCGEVTFTSSISPAPAGVARRANVEEDKNIELRLELLQLNEACDQTFIRLSDNEQVRAEFAFGEDMSKEFNKGKANIYTFIGSEQAAGNTLPMGEQTTIVPMGVKIASDGDYTFAIPDGTNGVGVTLIDSYSGTHTNLSALDYTVSLEAGTYDDRFLLQISPIHNTPTEIEASGVSDQKSDVRKLLIDGLLYIVRDGKMYDARGARVE